MPGLPAGEQKVLSWALRAARAEAAEPDGRIWIYWSRGVGLDDRLKRIPLPPFEPQEDEGIPGRVARTGEEIYCQDVRKNRQFAELYRPFFPETRAQWCLPLLPAECAADGEARPVLCLESEQAGFAGSRLRLRLVSLVAGIGLAAARGLERLESARGAADETVRWRLRRPLEELAALRPEPPIRKAFDLFAELYGAAGLSFWQVGDEEEGLCRPIYSSAAPAAWRDHPPAPARLVERTLSTGRPRFASAVAGEADLGDSFLPRLGVGATACVAGGVGGRGSLPAPAGRRRTRGLLFVHYAGEHDFGDDEREILAALANAAAALLELRANARLYRLTARSGVDSGLELPDEESSKDRFLRLLAPLLGLAEHDVQEDSPTSLLTAFLDLLLAGSTADSCFLYLRQNPGEIPRLQIQRGHLSPGVAWSLPPALAESLASGEPLFASGLPADATSSHPDVRAQAILPLRHRDVQYGTLVVEYRTAHRFTAEDRRFFVLLAQGLSRSLHSFESNETLFRKLNSLAESGTRIARIGSLALAGNVQIRAESSRLVEQAKELTGADFVTLFLREGEDFVLQAVAGGDPALQKKNFDACRLKQGRGLLGWVWRNRKPVNVADVLGAQGVELGYVENPVFPDTRSELVVPVLDKGQIVALIDLNSRRIDAFKREDLYFVQVLAAQAVGLRLAVEQREERRRLAEERDLLVRVHQIVQEAFHEDSSQVLERIMAELQRLLEASFLGIGLLCPDGFTFDRERSLALPEQTDDVLPWNLDNSMLGFAIRRGRESGQPYWLWTDVSHPPVHCPPWRRGTPGKCALLVAFLGRGPRITGGLVVLHPDAGYLEERCELIQAVVQGIENALYLDREGHRRAELAWRDRLSRVG